MGEGLVVAVRGNSGSESSDEFGVFVVRFRSACGGGGTWWGRGSVRVLGLPFGAETVPKVLGWEPELGDFLTVGEGLHVVCLLEFDEFV